MSVQFCLHKTQITVEMKGQNWKWQRMIDNGLILAPSTMILRLLSWPHGQFWMGWFDNKAQFDNTHIMSPFPILLRKVTMIQLSQKLAWTSIMIFGKEQQNVLFARICFVFAHSLETNRKGIQIVAAPLNKITDNVLSN